MGHITGPSPYGESLRHAGLQVKRLSVIGTQMRPRSQSSRSSTSQLSPPQISLTCLGSRGRGTQWAASGKNPPLSEYIAHLYPSGQSWAHMLQSSPGPGPHAGSEQVSFVVVDEGESVSPCVVVVVVAGEDVPTESLVAVADAAVADSTPASLPAHDQTTATLMRTNHRCCFETRDREVLHLSILGSLPDQLDVPDVDYCLLGDVLECIESQGDLIDGLKLDRLGDRGQRKHPFFHANPARR